MLATGGSLEINKSIAIDVLNQKALAGEQKNDFSLNSRTFPIIRSLKFYLSAPA